MATLPPDARDPFLADHLLAQEATRAGVVATYAATADAYWTQWCQFCRSSYQDPFLSNIDDPVEFLRVFAVRVRDGRNAPNRAPVRHGSVSQALRSVGQTFAFLGAATLNSTTQAKLTSASSVSSVIT